MSFHVQKKKKEELVELKETKVMYIDLEIVSTLNGFLNFKGTSRIKSLFLIFIFSKLDIFFRAKLIPIIFNWCLINK